MPPISSTNAGSENAFEPAFVLIGILQRPHGIHGEIAMRFYSDFPERMRVGRKVYIGSDHRPYRILDVRMKQDLYLLRFEGIEQREEAALLTNQEVFAAVKELPALPEGHYYHHQLIGLAVWEGDELLGELSEILTTGANDVYVIRTSSGKELLLPAIPDVIKAVDLVAGRMSVVVLNGLRDER
jgi:16S rRNA processing protein RimM